MVKNALTETDTFEVSAPLVPVAFQVTCPACAHEWDAGRVSEDHPNHFTPDEEDMFIKCHCGALITVQGVVVSLQA